MTKYLQLDGNTSYLQAPTLTFNEIIMDFTPRQTATSEYYIDTRTGGTAYIYNRSDAAEVYSGLTPYWNSATFQNGASAIGSGVRGTLRVVLSSQTTDDLTFLAGNAHTYNMAGDIFSIKVLLNGVVQAFYDMTTGTLIDQSGNGKNATFSGGTWLDDGIGGGTSLSISLSDSITLYDSISKRLTVTVIDSVNLTENTNASQGSKSATITDTILVTDTIVKKVINQLKTDAINTSDTDYDTTTKSLFDSITATDTISKSNGKSIILSDSITVTDAIFKGINLLKHDYITLTESVSKTAKIGIYDVIITTDELDTYNPNAPMIIGTIHLNGSQSLNVYLVGKQVVNVNLKGNQVVNVNLKGGI